MFCKKIKSVPLRQLPKKLDYKHTKKLCMSVLALTIEDASTNAYKDETLEFTKSNLCRNICEFYDIDYPSFLNKVESNYKGGKCGRTNKIHC